MKRLCLYLPLALFLAHGILVPAQTIKVLHSFSGGTDGSTPFGGVVRDAAGNLYGTTTSGGYAGCENPYGCGTVYKIDTKGTKTILYNFTGRTDGALPLATMIRDASGNLYGTTNYGGDLSCGIPSACGVVFKIDSSNRFTVLHRFTGAPDGANPWAGLVADNEGNLYGTTVNGGTVNSLCFFGCGVVFKIDRNGKESVLYPFSGGTDGAFPYATPVRDPEGNLYGTTNQGGDSNCFPSGCGTVFKLDAMGNETVLHAFASGTDAQFPQAGLTYFGGNLYGTSFSGGGAQNNGAVFQVDQAGDESVLYRFGSNTRDGVEPVDALIHDDQGNLYGTNLLNIFGYPGAGTVFKIDPSGNETILYTFGTSAGSNPVAGLTRDAAGNLYGTTQNGSTSSVFGTVFKLTP